MQFCFPSHTLPTSTITIMCRYQSTNSFPIEMVTSCSPKMPANHMNNMPANNFLFDDEDSSVRVQEDDTCFLLCIEMPNVCEKDIQISLQRNVLTISGFRRSTTYSYSSEDDSDDERRASFNNTRTKRQRVSRQLEIDPNAIDIERAMSSTWNGCYTLYAPKRQP